MTRRLLAIPFASTALLFAISFFPRIANSPPMRMAFWAACAVLLVWQAVLWLRPGLTLRVQFVPVRSHWVQAMVQFSVYLYWGSAWQPVYDFMPALFGQLVFLYTFDMLLQWTRRGEWTAGFGPFPITFSTNLFLWFRDQWFLLQFVQLAIGSLGKEFVRWKREGRLTHIFNPSAFSLMVSTVFLLTLGLTIDITRAQEIAVSQEAPRYIHLWIFTSGLVVQALFRVTLVTAGAVFSLLILNTLIPPGTSGLEYYGIPAPVFLGAHLLVTDPATSPRTLSGKAIFGMLYGVFVFPLFYALKAIGAPTLYDKLLSVPLLNLSVRRIDPLMMRGRILRLRERVKMSAERLNWIHMAAWAALFFFMSSTDRFGAKEHRDNSVEFWNWECDKGRPDACAMYVRLLTTIKGEGNAEAWNRLGNVYNEGKLLPADTSRAVEYYKHACTLGSLTGCQNTVHNFVIVREGKGYDDDVRVALDRLEKASGTDPVSAFLLGVAYSQGYGVPLDAARAARLIDAACKGGFKNPVCERLAKPGGK